MKTQVAAATALLSLAITASAQITKHQKYDWGWSYKLEMPETGLRCEFPEMPTVRTLAYGYMTAAQYKDELYIAAKLENPDAYDIACRTEEFTDELKRVYHLPIGDASWSEVALENGHLSLRADAKGGYAQFHIDAIATEDVLTIFLHAHHEELSVPGQFFADSYSIDDIPEGNIVYVTTDQQSKPARVIEKVNGSSVVRIQNSPVTVEWPEAPMFHVDRNVTKYYLNTHDAQYTTTVMEVGPEISYAFFNTVVNKQQQKMNSEFDAQVLQDETEIMFTSNHEDEAFFRKLTYSTSSGMHHAFYVAAENRIYMHEVSSSQMTPTTKRFMNSFDRSVHQAYDSPSIVMK